MVAHSMSSLELFGLRKESQLTTTTYSSVKYMRSYTITSVVNIATLQKYLPCQMKKCKKFTDAKKGPNDKRNQPPFDRLEREHLVE
jgi:hypothetical protein